MTRTSYALALGSNRRHVRHGGPEAVLFAALAALEAEGVAIGRVSRILRTPPHGLTGRRFANAAAIVHTSLDPPALLALLKRIEARFGRRRGRRWGTRVLDLDIILWSRGTWPRGLHAARRHEPRVPHLAFAGRDFVLLPLSEIAPQWRAPRSGLSVRQLLGRLKRKHR